MLLSASVPQGAKQAHATRDPRQWGWVEPTVWTERMLAALVNGVPGGKWYSRQHRLHGRTGRSKADHRRWPNAFFAAQGLFTITEAHALACQSR